MPAPQNTKVAKEHTRNSTRLCAVGILCNFPHARAVLDSISNQASQMNNFNNGVKNDAPKLTGHPIIGHKRF